MILSEFWTFCYVQNHDFDLVSLRVSWKNLLLELSAFGISCCLACSSNMLICVSKFGFSVCGVCVCPLFSLIGTLIQLGLTLTQYDFTLILNCVCNDLISNQGQLDLNVNSNQMDVIFEWCYSYCAAMFFFSSSGKISVSRKSTDII